MRSKDILSAIFLLASCAMLAIGRIYDERLDFFEIRFSLILSLIYIVSSFILIISIKKIKIGKSKNTLLFLYSYIFRAASGFPVLSERNHYELRCRR